MSLRRPPAPPVKPKTWRRSGDESYWDSLTRDSLTRDTSAPSPVRRPRPQSAIEGGQFDGWLKHFQRIQHRTTSNQEVGPFGELSVDKEVPYPIWRTRGGVLSSRGSSSGGTSLCGSSVGSEESLQTAVPSPPNRTDSWERVQISQVPKKEQTKVSFLTPVKIGWLPIRRKVTMVGEQGRNTDSGQVKLKQPITPTLLKNTASSSKSCNEEEVQRGQSKASAEVVRTAWQAPNQASPSDKQVHTPEKRVPSVSDSPVSWQSLKRGWRFNRVLALPGSSPTNNKTPTATSQDRPNPKAFTQPPIVPQDKPDSLPRTTFPNQSKDLTNKAPLHRTSSVQPFKASHIETTSATKTLVPENKAGFSSITISSRKVCRSASLPLSPPPTRESMNTNSRQVMVQRKATIVKVTQQTTTTTSPIRNGGQSVDQNKLASQNLDTVVHRRKATIIKVTEHRQSFTPSNASSQQKKNEYRHSYSEGLYKQNSIWSQENHAMQNTPTAIDSKPIHRSTLNLIVTTPPAIEAPPSRSQTIEKSNRPQRPSSCYGNVFSNSEVMEERKAQSVTRKFSLGSTEGNGVMNPVNGLNMTSANGAKSFGEVNNREEMAPPLTLIKTPDPYQTQEEVLALNAAAIIANIKLQRQLSKKKTPNGQSENGSASSLQEETEAAGQDGVKDTSSAKTYAAAFVPLSNDIQRSAQSVSLQEALQRSRPDFISRSQSRTQALERRALERRRGTTRSAQPKNCSNHGTAARDKLSKSSNRVVVRKDTRPTEVRKRQEEEARRDVSLNNRQRAELFKKKLLDQVLQRSKD